MMNRYLPLIFLLFSYAANAQSSVYHPFPEDSVVWRLDCGGLGFSCNCTCTGGVCVNESQRQYYYDGDTVINTLSYHKVFMDDFNMDYWQGPAFCQPGCNSSPHFYSSTASYVGALREDVAQKKVYFFQPFTSGEQVLYDFNLNVGDTLGPTMLNITNFNRVSVIDSVLIGSEYHRRYWLWDINNPNWTPQDSGYVALIEGIGSTFGLMEYLVPPFEFQCSMACVSIDSVTVYPMNGTTCNWLTAGISVPGDEKLIFTASPNPANESTMISWNGNFSEIAVSDVTGRQLAVFRDIPQKENDNQLELDMITWPAGIYLVKGTNSNGRSASVKVMKK